ncbi:glycosyl transferase [Bacillus cereus]|nr:glycosyl transferase [Bacillus cereus]PES95319.1 glycosyl transferase [Bacillus cereus]PGV59342.1 glycosyl transferase [Bacillus cereus]
MRTMDIVRLRNRNNDFNNILNQTDIKNIIELLHQIWTLNHEDFVWELYRQILHREPDEKGFFHFFTALTKGVAKKQILIAILTSREAIGLYSQKVPPSLPPNASKTISSLIHSFFLSNALHFIHALYNEFLARNPIKTEVQQLSACLKTKQSRIEIIKKILKTNEFQQILTDDNFTENSHIKKIEQKQNKNLENIGIYLGMACPTNLEGEGIGRFSTRLAEGLFKYHPTIKIYVVTNEINLRSLRNLFSQLVLLYPERLIFYASNSMEFINTELPVDVWIIPYIGLELAMYLDKPIILCLHDLVHLHFKDLYYQESTAEFCHRLDRFIHRLVDKASAIIFSSNFTRNHEGLQFLKLPIEKTHVVRLAAPVEEYTAYNIHDESSFRNKYKLYDDYIVYPSVIRPHKNHSLLIEAFMKFKQSLEEPPSNLKLVFTDHYRERPIHLPDVYLHCTNEQIKNSIVFLNRIPSDNVPYLYKYALGTIVPTLFEGSCPFPILESLILDTPIAASQIEVTSEVVTNMTAFFSFNPYSVEEMSKAIYELSKNGKQMLNRQKAAISTALNRRWTDVAKEYYDIATKTICT